jgi:hypothetical protein
LISSPADPLWEIKKLFCETQSFLLILQTEQQDIIENYPARHPVIRILLFFKGGEKPLTDTTGCQILPGTDAIIPKIYPGPFPDPP